MIEQYAKEIETKLNMATNEQILEGIYWYEEAREYCAYLANKYSMPLFKVVGVVAALSPSNAWDRNKKDAESFIVHGMAAKCCTYNSNKVKAFKVLMASDVDEVIEILNGNKIVNFFKNIYNVECDGVTVDRWALRVVKHQKSLTNKVYREISQAHHVVAHKYGYQPKEVQAITWIVERGSHA